MCSFIFMYSPQSVSDALLSDSNQFARHRGPDKTHIVHKRSPDGWHWAYVHNLLDISGRTVDQPVLEGEEGRQRILVFNGELYNYARKTCSSDTESLLLSFRHYGAAVCAHLDGEFAFVIHDTAAGEVLMGTDVFLSKPLHYAVGPDGTFGAASYASSLQALGFKDVQMAEPNSFYRVFLSGAKVSIQHMPEQVTFRLEQSETDYQRWEQAFMTAVRKRAEHGAHKPFVCMSSGYDSGAICLALNLQEIPYETITINAGETQNILNARYRANAAGGCRKAHKLRGLDLKERERVAQDISSEVEPFTYVHEDEPGYHATLQTDSGALGLGLVAEHAARHGLKVNLSGCGADEIISDYGMGGKKIYYHSQFGGLFPEDLHGFFPWKKFYGDTQRSYLFKDEFIFGRRGIEGRYPFLDRAVVQQFLSLAPELKNREYKAPIAQFLRKYGYPFESAVKKGFIPFAPERGTGFKNRLRSVFGDR